MRRLRRSLTRHSKQRLPAASAALLELARSGPAPLVGRELDESTMPSIAAIVPSFRRGSGGHTTIIKLLRELVASGHEVSVWLEDCEARHTNAAAAVTSRSFEEFFDARGLPLQTDFGSWPGADVVLATGWQTVARALLLPGAGARAYLVQDHEPEFYGTSAEAAWAEQSYLHGLHCLTASAWLAELLRSRYHVDATHFDLGVDQTVYRPTGEERREDLVVFYARAATPRRAVPLGILALTELSARHPELEIQLFGEVGEIGAPFSHRNRGVMDRAALASLYSQATVGVVLSLTNPSLTCLEMMACGLPCVELASASMLATFGADGPLQLADPDPMALCEAIETLLATPDLRQLNSRRGLELVKERTWARAGEQLQAGLDAALETSSKS
jgi:O-antigen biosynthesis protein